MAAKYLVTITDNTQREAVRSSGAEILAEYPSAVLVRCEEAARNKLAQAGLEYAELEAVPLQIGPLSFEMSAAVAAEAAAPVARDPHRRSYYLVQLVGPAKPEWMQALQTMGVRVYDSLPGDTLLVGIVGSAVDTLHQLSWVEHVTPYRPAMKLSPRFRQGAVPHRMAAADLATAAPVGHDAAQKQQIEVTMFPNESTEEVASRVRAVGGMVLRQSDQGVAAIVPVTVIHELAELPGVQAILPHAFPTFSNNKAAEIMHVPANRQFGPQTLRGEGQIVAIADSGLDTGDPNTMHRDFRGRIVQIRSLPVVPSLRQFANGPTGFNDGPADLHSAHGTHVAGSVLGSGEAATTAGSTDVPVGIAPAAQVFFQAVEQQVSWKPGVPLPAVGLFGLPENLESLFDEAYQAGARIHTNSWGGPAKDSNGLNIAGAYTQNAREVDNFAFIHADMLILFAVGNDGEDEDGANGQGDGKIDPDSIGSPASAKNCLSVGASENRRPPGSIPAPGVDANWAQFRKPDGEFRYPKLGLAKHVSDNPEGMAAFSSRGPSDDRRIKPDLVAPGTNVLSVRSSVFQPTPQEPEPLWGDVKPANPPHPLRGLYCFSGGTSMSTPLVAGAAALVRQFLINARQHFKQGEKPSSALVKAILINGATAMDGNFAGEIPPLPNAVCGFGRVNLTDALADPLFDDEQANAVGTGEMRVYECVVRDRTKPFKVTMVWTDAPATVGVGGLTNKLYMQLVAPGGQIRDGDVKPFPNAVNNVQQILVNQPEAGTYRIRVRGVSVVRHAPIVVSPNRPKQNFALVVSNGETLRLLP
jgi:serine protease AprX